MTPTDQQQADAIVSNFAQTEGIPLARLFSPSTRRYVSHPKKECMRHLQERTSLSLVDIGLVLGGLHHSTVKHGIDAAKRRAEQ